MMLENHNYPKAAKSFAEAYANTNYLRPLKGEAIKHFYVERPSHSELNMLLGELMAGANISPPNNTKFLFVGHTGSGKSTELSRLTEMIENGLSGHHDLHKTFLPIQYSISEVVGLYNIEFVDIALSILLGIYREMERLGCVIDDTPAYRVYDWLYQNQALTNEKAPLISYNGGSELGLGNLIRLIDIRLKSEGQIREEIRARIRKYIPELITLINQVIYEASIVTGKNILLIVDDLDKIQPLESALNIFREHARSLASLECFAIYTAPISLLYDPTLKYIDQFLEIHYMPMFQVRTRDGKQESSESLEVRSLLEIIYRRIHPDLFSEGVAEAAIQMTGGILRELIRVIRGCCLYCEEYDIGQITHSVLDYQRLKLKREYYRILQNDDYRRLRCVSQTKSRADVDMRHLESLCVLYYSRNKGWFDVHPLIYELLQEWEENNQDFSTFSQPRLTKDLVSSGMLVCNLG